jgi:uncharacterized protein
VRVFADTSALYPLIDADDADHDRVASAFPDLRLQDATLVTTSYTLVETVALLQARSGLAAVRTFEVSLRPLLDVIWVDADLHVAAARSLLAADRRRSSLVDWVGFTVMRDRGIERAFALDDDFREQGFDVVP